MKTFELKSILYQKIAEINDKSFLSAINTIIESKSISTTFKTNSIQQYKIEEGKVQIKNGKSFTDVEVENELNKWFKEK
jgi:hypothetical protein